MNDNNNQYEQYKTPEYIRYGNEHSPEKNIELEEFRRKQDLYIRSKRTRGSFVRNFLILAIVAAIAYGVYWGYQEFLKPIDVNQQIDRNSPHYVNDLYASDGRFYERLLDADQKEFYMEWLASIKDIKKEFIPNYSYFKGQDIDKMKMNIEYVYKVMTMDHPELFYLSNIAIEGIDVYEMTIHNNYIIDNKTIINLYERRLMRKMDDLYYRWKDLKTDYAKETAVYNYISSKSVPAGETRITSTATSALLESRTNHIGAAKASQIIFQRIGVKSDLVFGYLDFPRVFNIVYLSDGPYYYDSGIGVETRDKKNMSRKQYGLNVKDYLKYNVDYIKPDRKIMGVKYLNDIF